MELVAKTPSFENPPVDVIVRPQEEEVEVEDEWGKIPDEEKPSISVVDQEQMLQQVKELELEEKRGGDSAHVSD